MEADWVFKVYILLRFLKTDGFYKFRQIVTFTEGTIRNFRSVVQFEFF